MAALFVSTCLRPCRTTLSWSMPLVQKLSHRTFSTEANYGSSVVGGDARGPLHGIRVLDMTRILAGPFATMLLGDMGAEVIKIERPGRGDDTRSFGPPFRGTESVYFMSINRNKKSVAVNIKSAKGQEIIQKLAAKSDVLLENYPSGKLDPLGLGYTALNAVNPRLVYCSITGYGASGPKAHRLGYDVVASAESGLMHVTGPKDGEPVKVGVAMTDLSTGLYAYGAIMAALMVQQRTGKGQKIDCNLISTQVSLMTHLAGNYLNAGMKAQSWGTAHQSIVPYQAFKTKDGKFLIIGSGNNSHFEILCRVLEMEELPSDERFATNSQRVQHRDTLIPLLSERFLQKTLSEWLTLLEGNELPFGPVNDLQQVFEDPQVQHLGLVRSMSHPTAGDVKVIGPAVTFSDSVQSLRLPAPILGQHTHEVLNELCEYSLIEIQDMTKDGVVQTMNV